jgi:hypothetical protein
MSLFLISWTLYIVFHILDHVKTKNPSEPVVKFTDWERFHSLASNLISPKIEINWGKEADKATRDFTASIASAYKLSTSKITLFDLNNDIPGLDCLFKHKQRLRKLWQETRDSACKAAINRVEKTIRQLSRRMALERWENKIGNCGVTPQATRIWPTAKSIMKRNGSRAPNAIHGPLGLKFHPL